MTNLHKFFCQKFERRLATPISYSYENIHLKKDLIKRSIYKQHAIFRIPMDKFCHKAKVFWLIVRKWIKIYIFHSGENIFSKGFLWTSEMQFLQPHWKKFATRRKKVYSTSDDKKKFFSQKIVVPQNVPRDTQFWSWRWNFLEKSPKRFCSLSEYDWKTYVFTKIFKLILARRRMQYWQPRQNFIDGKLGVFSQFQTKIKKYFAQNVSPDVHLDMSKPVVTTLSKRSNQKSDRDFAQSPIQISKKLGKSFHANCSSGNVAYSYCRILKKLVCFPKITVFFKMLLRTCRV